MADIMEYAKMELDRLLTHDDTDEDKAAQKAINKQVCELVEVFSKQGHSGYTATYTISVLSRLLSWKPLSPLMGTEDEWEDVTKLMGNEGDLKSYQNRRCSSVIKKVDAKGRVVQCVDLDAVVCSDNGGLNWFTTMDFQKPVTFPYAVPERPERVYVKEVNGHYVVITDQEEIRAAFEAARAKMEKED